MFRRGPFRPRALRRLMRAGGLLGVHPRQRLNEAHMLMAAGQYKEAAQLFAQLSDSAIERGMFDRAGNLALQAARCYLETGDTQTALARARQGLKLLLQAGREHRASKALQQVLAALRARNLKAEADALQKEFASLLSADVGTESTSTPRGHLPPKCPNCGGPMRSDEVDWIDERSAECPYCGSPVETVE